MTRAMPPLEALHEKPTETAPDDEAQAAADALTEALDEAEAGEEQTATAPDAVAADTDATDEGSLENDEASDEESPEDSEAHDEEAAETDDAGEEFSEDAEESSEENEAANKPQLPAFLLEEDDRYGGESPSRTYWGKKYHGGYSDHLPVLLELELKEE